MTELQRFALPVVLSALIGTSALAQQEAPPKGPFRTVHLFALKADADVAILQAALEDANAVVAKTEYRDVRYRLYKVAGTQAGPHNYLMESSWPSGEAYDKVHKSEAWTAAWKRHPKVESLLKDEVYNRYVEVPSQR